MAVQGALTTEFYLSEQKGSTAIAAIARPANGYAAVPPTFTWRQCGEITNAGEFGQEFNVVPVMNLATGATRKFKGSFNNGSMQIDLLFDSADVGQTELEEAVADKGANALRAFRAHLPEGEDFFFTGIVTMLKRIVGGPDDAIMMRATVEIDHQDIVEGKF